MLAVKSRKNNQKSFFLFVKIIIYPQKIFFFAYIFYLCPNIGGNKFSYTRVSPKWVKSKRWRRKEEKRGIYIPLTSYERKNILSLLFTFLLVQYSPMIAVLMHVPHTHTITRYREQVWNTCGEKNSLVTPLQSISTYPVRQVWTDCIQIMDSVI